MTKVVVCCKTLWYLVVSFLWCATVLSSFHLKIFGSIWQFCINYLRECDLSGLRPKVDYAKSFRAEVLQSTLATLNIHFKRTWQHARYHSIIDGVWSLKSKVELSTQITKQTWIFIQWYTILIGHAVEFMWNHFPLNPTANSFCSLSFLVNYICLKVTNKSSACFSVFSLLKWL